MNILGGVLPADRGEIVIDGTPVHFRTPRTPSARESPLSTRSSA